MISIFCLRIELVDHFTYTPSCYKKYQMETILHKPCYDNVNKEINLHMNVSSGK